MSIFLFLCRLNSCIQIWFFSIITAFFFFVVQWHLFFKNEGVHLTSQKNNGDNQYCTTYSLSLTSLFDSPLVEKKPCLLFFNCHVILMLGALMSLFRLYSEIFKQLSEYEMIKMIAINQRTASQWMKRTKENTKNLKHHHSQKSRHQAQQQRKK